MLRGEQKSPSHPGLGSSLPLGVGAVHEEIRQVDQL